MSSAGLIYKHFGMEVIKNIAKEEYHEDLNDEILTKVWEKIYGKLIKEVDAIDNGVNQSNDKLTYYVRSNLSSRIGELNPPWNAPQTSQHQNG